MAKLISDYGPDPARGAARAAHPPSQFFAYGDAISVFPVTAGAGAGPGTPLALGGTPGGINASGQKADDEDEQGDLHAVEAGVGEGQHVGGGTARVGVEEGWG